MNSQQVEQFVMRYLDATGCQIIEKTPGKVTVKLSPAADKQLTGRSYYWSFVERTGAEPETMSFTFVFDPELAEAAKQQQLQQQTKQPEPQTDSILGRYFGFVPTQPRSLEEKVAFGSGRLEQIFQAAKLHGKFVHLYEAAQHEHPMTHPSTAYHSWFVVNYKVEFVCDMKREEIHSFAISLSTGEIVEHAHDKLAGRHLTPRLPANTHIKELISPEKALAQLEKHLYDNISRYDHTWSCEAHERLEDELDRIHSYYRELIQGAEPEVKSEFEAQYENRKREIRWQYEPRIQVSVINCGIFHLINDITERL